MGLRIAEDECTAAIVTDGDEEPLFIVRESLLYMSDDGDATLGGPPPDENAHAITGFALAVGDPAGISVDDGEAYRAEDLVATALFCLINLTADHLNGPAEFYATHPGDWPREYIQALRDALDYLGLRSVLLVSEADLPSAETGEPGSTFAYDAARAALAAVLSTPAGSTPPDPTHAENSTVDTVIIPAVPASEPTPQAYSAAIPMAEPVPTEATEAPDAPARKAEPAKDRKQLPLLIGAAALIGLVLGGFAVAVLFRDDGQTPVPPMRDAKSDQVTVSPTPPAPPINFPTVPLTPTTTEAPETTTTPPPPPTTEPPPPPPPTTEPPTTPPSTTRPRPTTTTPYNPLPQIPTIPGLQIPGSR
ncbi:hypothetical protein F3087_02520 [Nocardia colli]|uniref:Uncharacterized protein n=1 Tax=Nocardia colli TaxID=2545717 RepID=A0A5N0EPU8_9NOCA|nr:hypothetical protein F3087_02520 [Nocardia colli]